MWRLASVALLALSVLALVACVATSQTLPPKPCRLTSSKAECERYLARKAFRGKQFRGVPPRTIQIEITQPRCPDARFPALCKKR